MSFLMKPQICELCNKPVTKTKDIHWFQNPETGNSMHNHCANLVIGGKFFWNKRKKKYEKVVKDG